MTMRRKFVLAAKEFCGNNDIQSELDTALFPDGADSSAYHFTKVKDFQKFAVAMQRMFVPDTPDGNPEVDIRGNPMSYNEDTGVWQLKDDWRSHFPTMTTIEVANVFGHVPLSQLFSKGGSQLFR
jgi:hypothetical protein